MSEIILNTRVEISYDFSETCIGNFSVPYHFPYLNSSSKNTFKEWAVIDVGDNS